MKLTLGQGCLAIFLGAIVALMLPGCAFFSGLWTGETATHHTCVSTSRCTPNNVEVVDDLVCIQRGAQDEAEAKLAAREMDKLKAKGCAEPRVWVSCGNDGTPCGL